MMKTINQVTILGYLATDIKILSKEGSSRKAITFRVKTINNFTTSNGEVKKEEDFHNVVAFEHFAERIVKFCNKGDKIMLQGRLRNRNYTKLLVEHQITEIVVENISFIDHADKWARVATEEDKKDLFVDFGKPDSVEETLGYKINEEAESRV